MPGPPPPPPPGGPPPPPAFMPPPPTKGGANDRSALLQQIHKGRKLKKVVTVDKSGPCIPGKTNQNTSNNNTSIGSNGGGGGRGAPATSSGPAIANGLGLGALFQDGIPKLKATGKNLGGVKNSSAANSNITSSNPPAPRIPEAFSQQQRNFAYTQKELKKQMASDNRNRGPPPPAPVRNFTVGQSQDDVSSTSKSRNGALNGFHNNLLAPNLEANSSTLHRKASSNVNLHSLDSTDSSNESSNFHARPSNFGKPNLAPKPPQLNGKPKKLSLNGKPIVRTQSMKSPRSPSPQSGDSSVQNMPPKFGTVRNIPPGFAESLSNLHQKQRPPLNERPKAPPPSVPQQYNPSTPPPPSKLNMVKHPGHAPPPPPNISFVQSIVAPPLPPHRTAPQIPSRVVIASIPANLNANGNAPPPPPRNSSIKDGAAGRRTSSPTDFDVKFANRFHDVSEFPRPSQFRNMPKIITSRPVGGNKQQAPLPPNHIHLGNNRLWDSSTC